MRGGQWLITQAIVRGKAVAAKVAKMPFVPNRYYKKP
jgi:hypothetical protein